MCDFKFYTLFMLIIEISYMKYEQYENSLLSLVPISHLLF